MAKRAEATKKKMGKVKGPVKNQVKAKAKAGRAVSVAKRGSAVVTRGKKPVSTGRGTGGGVRSVNGSHVMKDSQVLLPRSKVRVEDTWDLTRMYANEAAFEAEFARATEMLGTFGTYAGRLGEGPGVVREFLKFDEEHSLLVDRLAVYASLRTSEDQGDSGAQGLRARVQFLSVKTGEESSFFQPELMELPPETIEAYLKSEELAEYRLLIERIVRYRPHTLTKGEERLLAMQGQVAESPGLIFRQLNDADMKFGMVRDERGREIELGHSSFTLLLQSPKREVRETAFRQYYKAYDAHRNTIAASLAGAVHRDVFYARARNFNSAREAALFPDNMPASVYDNLVSTVRANLPAVHRYFELRKRAMKLRDLHHYDTYVPILAEMKKRHTWDQAVKVVCDSLSPLGSEYVETLRQGLTTARWCDRYPNQGKNSGAYSSGMYDSPPYILMNYQEEVLEHVFTLTHEAGHSMHSWYSKKNQPYTYYRYVIFVAEVASTFNEQLLARHLMANATDDRERAYLINRQIDGIRGTIIRQTMFAEFERDIHAMAEAGEPLTLDAMRSAYRKLLDAYFGPGFVVDKELELECLRIPHFYRGFYVYKYATGLSAAIAIAERVVSKVPGALEAYLSFLKSGGSKFPLDLLRDAGVDMEKPAPVESALRHFEALVTELESLV